MVVKDCKVNVSTVYNETGTNGSKVNLQKKDDGWTFMYTCVRFKQETEDGSKVKSEVNV